MKILALALGVIFIILAILTATGVASFAHVLGVDGVRHLKHTILYAVLAILCFIWARFAGAK